MGKPQNTTEPTLLSVTRNDVVNGTTIDGVKIEINGNHLSKNGNSESAAGSDVKEAVHNKPEPRPPKVSLFKLFRFSDKTDVFLMFIGTFGALSSGATVPVSLIVFGRLLSTFILGGSTGGNQTSVNATNPFENALEQVTPLLIAYCALAVIGLTLGYLMMAFWSWTSERQIRRIRVRFFRSVMSQDIGWFDSKKSGEITSRFADDAQYIHQAIGDKLALFLHQAGMWVSSTTIALVLRWDLALVALAGSPVLVTLSNVIQRYVRSVTKQELIKYGKAGAVAAEVFGAIRTVHAFQGQAKECERYISNLSEAQRVATKRGLVIGVGAGLFWAMMFIIFSVAFWFSMRLLLTEGLDPGNVVPILFNVVMGSSALGTAFTYLETLSTGLASARMVFHIIDTAPKIDSTSEKGVKPATMEGSVEFRNVFFKYPSRPDVKILNDFSLKIPKGKMVSLVGPSGCGKSTTIQLLQRFYDVLGGQILVDGRDVRELNLKWLRHHIGVVNQEPVLFDTTIKENIRYGNMDVTDEGIEKAARQANAHTFISHLPQGYDTMVGDRGSHLSGGQKQRIAIARALVQNPKILLLDEATSALDNESEAIVQNALEKAGQGRTTIVIAHRLSTVKDADMIVFLNEGRILEKGTHEQLLAENGLYANLVKLQQMRGHDDSDSDTDSEDDLEDIMEDEEQDEILKKTWSSRKEKKRKLKSKEDDVDVDPTKDEGTEEQEEKAAKTASLKTLLRLNAPEWGYLTIGCLGAMVSGCVMPAFAVMMSEFIRVLGLQDPEVQMSSTLTLVGGMVGMGAANGIARLLQGYGFSKSGAALTARLRGMAFTSIVSQDMEFFDDPKNRIGYLTARLSSDAQLLQSTTTQIGFILEAGTSMSTAIIVAFIFSWRLAVVIVWMVPILFAAGVVHGRTVKGISHEDKKTLQETGKVCLDATENIRTVVSLGVEDIFINKYEGFVQKMYRSGFKASHARGLAHGSIQFFTLLGNAACFAYGMFLLQKGQIEFFVVIRVFMALVYGAREGGRTTSSMEDYRKGKIAAGRLFALIERKPTIVSTSEEGQTLENYSGKIAMTNLSFHYKSRPKVKVLNQLNLEVHPGQSLALVGPSGCGKSTTIQILERFYDVKAGIVTADDFPMQRLNLIWWRSQMALVSQEPTLFDASVAYNIAYGDNSREVGMDEVITAARMANIHTFIEALPEGYETNVGSKGTQLSGGQKQRIAIARALIRNPKILLLDEATSALDSESERIVQETLDQAREGRTCIIIAHRLSTIQNADKIAVIKHGAVVELGSHSELLAQKGVYSSLVQSQNTKRRQSTAVIS